MEIIKQLLLQLVLILLNAFFAATEIAVISLNEKKVKARADDGDKKAVKMLKMIKEPTGFLSTIQIGITLAGFLGSAFAADNFAERISKNLIHTFHISESHAGAVNTVAVVLTTLILSYFTLVLGELVPKRIAMKHKEKLAEKVCGFITGLATILRPIIWFLTKSTNAALRLCGIDPNEKEEPVSEEDIVIMLDAGADEGTIDGDDVEYIKNVFKLDRLTAEDVMTPRKQIVTITEEESAEDVIRVIEEEGYSRIPVCEDSMDHVIGILYSKEYLLKYRESGFHIGDILTEPVYVPETMPLDVLFKEMQSEHNHMVVVVNEYGVSSGIVTMEDIIEEILGEIWDESDEAVEDIIEDKDGSYLVLCTTSLPDFTEFFDVEIEDEIEATTVNGWLIEKFKQIPEEGFEFDFANLHITVVEADEMMTQIIRVIKTEPEPSEEETEE